MRIRRMYVTALAVSGSAMLLAGAALVRPAWHPIGSRLAPSSHAEFSHRETPLTQDAERLEKLAAQIADLAARIAALEKSMSADSQIELLTDINAALQATAKSGAKNAADVAAIERRMRDLTSSTQAAFNAVGQELGNMRSELVKEVERQKKTEYDAKASVR